MKVDNARFLAIRKGSEERTHKILVSLVGYVEGFVLYVWMVSEEIIYVKTDLRKGSSE